VNADLYAIQKECIETSLLKKWSLGVGNQEPPHLVVASN
jgi:hypothetical protein